MNIFCRETRAHLALQGLAGLSSNNLNTSGGLITPELWLRDCHSPTIPPSNLTENEELVVDNESIIWPEACIKNRDQIQRISKKNERQLFGDTINTISDIPQQLYNFEYTNNDTFADETKEAIKESLNDEEERKTEKYREMNSLISFDASVESGSPVAYKNLHSNSRDCSKESSTDYSREGAIYLKDVRKLLEKGVKKMCHKTLSCRSQKISMSHDQHSENQTIFQIPPRDITIERPHILQPMPFKFTPRWENILKSSSMTMKPPQLHYVNDRFSTNSKSGLLPPFTVLVPYPIPIPIPLPIPIPIPLFGNFFDSKNYNLCKTKDDDSANISVTDINVEIPIAPEDLSQRGKTKNSQNENILKQIQSLNVVERDTILLDSTNSSSPVISSVVTSRAPHKTMTIPDIVPIVPIAPTTINSKPTRKRQRQSVASDQIDMKIKPRSKFISS
ncbi:hypothetical protein PV327_008525 [Microctonus hyperodae]|uniref:Uncharacterized protein n=1 Tax=Microctonus hyperodae TaxID=165561 RepID=A0AA39F3B3_MICHY|nr:hypothetical protein PV327_008525 [Microctonus hyperodae]